MQKWNDFSFERTTLLALGLQTNLGHRLGESCANPVPREITVIHSNGIHEIAVTICQCNPAISLRQIYLRAGWWPATAIDPRTVTTFEALRQFQYQNLQGNITAFDYYRALELQTDGRLSIKLPVCFSSDLIN